MASGAHQPSMPVVALSRRELAALAAGPAGQGRQSLLQLVGRLLDALSDESAGLHPLGRPSAEGMCLILCRRMHELLAASGIDSMIVEGDVEIAHHDWLEHYVVLIPTQSCWLLLDPSASQLPWLSRSSYAVIITAPKPEAALGALASVLRWWRSPMADAVNASTLVAQGRS